MNRRPLTLGFHLPDADGRHPVLPRYNLSKMSRVETAFRRTNEQVRWVSITALEVTGIEDTHG